MTAVVAEASDTLARTLLPALFTRLLSAHPPGSGPVAGARLTAGAMAIRSCLDPPLPVCSACPGPMAAEMSRQPRHALDPRAAHPHPGAGASSTGGGLLWPSFAVLAPQDHQLASCR